MLTFKRPTILGRAKGKHGKETKNIVIFGETGVGKSSLINLIAGEDIAETSSSAVGCTLSYKRYALSLSNQRFAIWDTAGLDEGTQGSVPAEKAEAYLKQLLRDLVKSSGIDLLIYCVRATRVRSALLTNYHLFYSALCRKKVPIAIVVTGLENQEGNMDTWWLKNERQFSALRMRFDGYACITTLQSSMQNPMLEERRKISRASVIKMIMNTCRTEQWMPAERSWVDTAFPDIRAILSPREENKAHVANVVMCDVSRGTPISQGAIKRSVTLQIPVVLSLPLTWLIGFRRPVSVVSENPQSRLPFHVSMKCTQERLFRVHQVPLKQSPRGKEEETKRDLVLKRGADLLVFCVERTEEYRSVRLQWEHFKLTYGGDLSPQIIIIIGATDQKSAEEWWNDTVLGGAVTQPSDASIAYWPMNESFASVEAAKGRLRNMINTCSIDCSKANFVGDKRIFRHSTSPRLDKSPRSLWARSQRNGKVDEPGGADQNVDILTKWDVWEHVSTERDAVSKLDAMS